MYFAPQPRKETYHDEDAEGKADQRKAAC